MASFSWNSTTASWQIEGGLALPLNRVKFAAEALVSAAEADIGLIVTDLVNGELSATAFEIEMARALDRLDIAQTSLGRGGFPNLTEEILKGSSERLAIQREFLAGFVKDIASGKLSTKQIGARASSYANAGRSAYENELLGAKQDAGLGQACRILGANDHCPDCVEWAAMGWMDADVMESQYPIGSGQCHDNCRCILVFRRSENSRSSDAVNTAIENAKAKQLAYQQLKEQKEQILE